jgi:hypothetical protein
MEKVTPDTADWTRLSVRSIRSPEARPAHRPRLDVHDTSADNRPAATEMTPAASGGSARRAQTFKPRHQPFNITGNLWTLLVLGDDSFLGAPACPFSRPAQRGQYRRIDHGWTDVSAFGWIDTPGWVGLTRSSGRCRLWLPARSHAGRLAQRVADAAVRRRSTRPTRGDQGPDIARRHHRRVWMYARRPAPVARAGRNIHCNVESDRNDRTGNRVPRDLNPHGVRGPSCTFATRDAARHSGVGLPQR